MLALIMRKRGLADFIRDHIAKKARTEAYMPRVLRYGASPSGPRSPAAYTHSRQSGSGTGHYKGPLPKPRRTSKPGPFAIHGFRGEFERYGTPAQSNVVYLGATSAPVTPVGSAVGVALIRKLMRRHFQYEYTDPNQYLRAAGNGTATGGGGGLPETNSALDFTPAYLKFFRRLNTAAGAIITENFVTYDFVTSPTATVLNFGEWFALNIFNTPALGAGTAAGNAPELWGYQFIVFDAFGTSVPHTAGTSFRVSTPIIPLTDQYLKVYSTVRMHIQNITPADITDTGANLLSTRIDANPIKGALMRFKDPTPVLNNVRGTDGSAPQDGAFRLQQDTNADGIIWPNASLTGNWIQIPKADQFKNCVGSTAISLEPGDIKDYTITFKYSGTLEKLIRGFRGYTTAPPVVGGSTGAPNPDYEGAFGTSFLFALEKRMPTGPAQVQLNFHYEHYYGAVFGKRRMHPMVSYMGHDGISAIPDAQ